MNEQDYSLSVLHNEIQNLKQRVSVLETETREDKKEWTQAVKAIGESLIKLTTIQEQQSKQIEDLNKNVDMLRDEISRNNEDNIKWYQSKYDLFIKILITLTLVGWSIKGFSEVMEIINP